MGWLNCSAVSVGRKWPCGCRNVAVPAVVSAVIWLTLIAPVPVDAKSALRAVQVPVAQGPVSQISVAHVPLPQPRPAAAPPREDVPPDSGKTTDKGPEPDKPSAPAKSEPATPASPQVSACRMALTDDIAIAPSIPDIHGPGGCGGTDLVRLEAVMLPDKRRVALTPAGIMRCPMASAVANWVRNDVVPLADKLGSPLVALDNFDSYECRGRNRVVGAQLSEHGRANALDVRGLKLADGRMIGLTDRTQPRDIRETVLRSVCTRFSTVLGPDSDWYHEDHIHLDLMERRNNYRICQWDVLDPLPKVAPLLPAMRPEEAPPRETADAGDKAKGQGNAKGGAIAAPAAAGDGEPVAAERGNQPDVPAPPPAAAPQIAAPMAPSGRNTSDGRASASVPSAPAAVAKPSSKLPASQMTKSNASTDKTSAGKTSADSSASGKPATKKRQQIHRGWNPFGPFF